jgi:hypothetical protein
VNQNSEQIEQELNRRYQATLLVFFSQLAVTVVLTVVAWFAASQSSVSAPVSVINILWIVLLVIAIGAFLLRRFIFAPDVLHNAAIVKGASGLLKSLQLKTILLNSAGELIAVIGFVIALLSGDALDMLRAAAIALIVFFISFPSKATWRRVVQAAAK